MALFFTNNVEAKHAFWLSSVDFISKGDIGGIVGSGQFFLYCKTFLDGYKLVVHFQAGIEGDCWYLLLQYALDYFNLFGYLSLVHWLAKDIKTNLISFE